MNSARSGSTYTKIEWIHLRESEEVSKHLKDGKRLTEQCRLVMFSHICLLGIPNSLHTSFGFDIAKNFVAMFIKAKRSSLIHLHFLMTQQGLDWNRLGNLSYQNGEWIDTQSFCFHISNYTSAAWTAHRNQLHNQLRQTFSTVCH